MENMEILADEELSPVETQGDVEQTRADVEQNHMLSAQRNSALLQL